MDGLAPPGGGFGLCGGTKPPKSATVSSAPVATVTDLLSKDVEMATLRGALRRALGGARRG